MTTEQFSNFAQTTLNGNISAGVTSVAVISAANFPLTGQFRIAIDQEIFLVTNVAGNNFTVIPGYEGTNQASHSSGAAVAHIMTAGVISGIYNNAASFAAPRIQAFGDSRASYCGLNVNQSSSIFSNPAIQYISRSPIAWANRFLRGRLNFDLTLGYVGAFQGVSSVKVLNGGTNYTAPTVSFSGTGSGLTFGVPIVSGGVIQSVPVTSQGINFTSLPTLTVSDSTGSGALLQAIIGGTGTFGVSGETTAQCINRLRDVISSPSDIIFVCIGTNDLTNGISASASKANLQIIFDALISAGKFVIYCPDQARSYWASLSGIQITNARHQMYNVKRWAYQYAMLANGKNPGGNKRIFICDGEDFWANAADANGNPQPVMTSDGMHWSTASAQATGLRMAQGLQQLMGLGSAASIISQADGYDSTYNPDGALNFGWLMNAATIAPNAPLTGSIAGNFNAFRNSGSATGTMAASIETTRTDGLSGNRQVFTFSLGGGTTSEQFNFGITDSTIASYNINIGDTVMAECDMWLSGQTNVNTLALQINFYNSSFATLIQSMDGDLVTDKFIQSGAYMALNGDATPMTFKTPPVIIPANSNNFTCYVTIGFDGSGVAGSATATWKIANFRLRKVV